jgi:hypothetical protein
MPFPTASLLLALGLLALAAVPGAEAQGNEYQLVVNGQPTAEAARPDDAVLIDPDEAVAVNVTGSGPADATVTVSIRLFGYERELGRSSVDMSSGRATTNVTLVGLDRLGAGLFWVEVRLAGENLDFEQAFLVRVENGPLVTVQGVVLAVASIVVAYGVWRLVTNATDLFLLWANRPERPDGEPAPAPGATAETVPEPPPSGVREAVLQASEAPVVAWTLTSFGVALTAASWFQFFGLAPLDAGLLVTALEYGAGLFTLGVIAYALTRRRARRRVAAPRPAAPGAGSSP